MLNNGEVPNLHLDFLESQSFKKLPSGREDCVSPKFVRKRPFLQKKPETKREMGEQICFISPRKQLEHLNRGCESTTSLSSIVSDHPLPQSKCNKKFYQFPDRGFGSSSNLRQNYHPSKDNRTAETIASKPSATEQNHELRQSERKLLQISQRLRMMKQENSFLYNKIEEFNSVINEKNTIINQFSQLLKQKQEQLAASHKKVEEMKITVSALTKSLEQSLANKFCANISDETTDDEEKQKLEEEVARYKQQIVSLTATIKYNQIQDSMYKKIKFDYDSEVEKNEKLKAHNRRLLTKIESLMNQCRPVRKNKGLQKQKANRRYDSPEISFELSPEKSPEKSG